MQIESCLSVALLTELTLKIGGMLANHLKVIILKTLTDFKVSVEALFAYFLVRVLDEVNQVLWYTHVKTSFDLVGVSGLEDGSHHGEGATFTCLFQVGIIQSRQRLSDWDQLVIISTGTVHWDEVAHRQMRHLFTEDLGGLKGICDAGDEVTDHRVAALTSA